MFGWLITLGEVLGAAVPAVGATKRLLKAARETEPPPPAAPPPKPLGRNDYIDGMLDATERQRNQALGERMTRDATKLPADWSDD